MLKIFLLSLTIGLGLVGSLSPLQTPDCANPDDWAPCGVAVEGTDLYYAQQETS